MSGWRAAYTNNYGEYEITFESKDRAKTKAVEKVCCAIMDGLVKSPDDVIIGAKPKGKWVASKLGYLCCSECHDAYVDPEWIAGGKWKYCPSCGARMEE